MNKNAIEQATDQDMASSLIAIRRAAKRARKVAAQTGTSLIVSHGKQFDRVTVTKQDSVSKETAG